MLECFSDHHSTFLQITNFDTLASITHITVCIVKENIRVIKNNLCTFSFITNCHGRQFVLTVSVQAIHFLCKTTTGTKQHALTTDRLLSPIVYNNDCSFYITCLVLGKVCQLILPISGPFNYPKDDESRRKMAKDHKTPKDRQKTFLASIAWERLAVKIWQNEVKGDKNNESRMKHSSATALHQNLSAVLLQLTAAKYCHRSSNYSHLLSYLNL